MTAKAYGPWINVSPSEVVGPTGVTSGPEGIESSPSPYDVPMALRIDEGDLADPAYAVELRYLGGDERTSRNRIADLEVEVGTKSGRLYRIIVEAKSIDRRARSDVQKVAKVLEGAHVSPSGAHQFNMVLVSRAIDVHADELAQQLAKSIVRSP